MLMMDEDEQEEEEEIPIHGPEEPLTSGYQPDIDIENDLTHQSAGSEEYEMTAIPENSQGENNGNLKVLCCEKVFLLMAACTAAIGGIMFGYDVGVISGALLQLRQEFHLSCNQQAILVSFLLLGATIGAIISGFLVDLLGRKLTILVNGIIFTLGSITLALAKSFYILVCGRLLLGCAVSISAVAECIYISEIAPAKRRGLLVSFNELGITLGLLISYLVNFLFIDVNHGWRYMFGIAAFPAIFQVVAMFFLPKSPRFLLMKGKERQAARILKRLHGQTMMEVQLNSIKMALLKEKRFKFKDLFQSSYNMRGRLILGFGLAFFQQFTGQPNILYYAPVVFQAVGFPSDSAAELATLGLGTVKVTAAINGSLWVSTTVEPFRNSTGKSEESASFHLIHIITILALMGYVGAYGISFGPITWIILSEIYPPAIRGRAVALVTVINWAANFIVSSMFLQVISLFTLPGTFFLFTAMSVLSVIFVFFCIPETKNKSLEQISKELSSTPFSWNSFKCIWLLKPCCYILTHFSCTFHNPYSVVSMEDQSSSPRSL
ncbi:SLC2A12 [Acanthosepion pharaonis]|uniref:SLC2A12 n=1 Tax=Acanthosepion pharaonis TaxID=158019 RepID=A0A812EY25_ACAPH|nr:SLC2A12 [Sepia pharaonis]